MSFAVTKLIHPSLHVINRRIALTVRLLDLFSSRIPIDTLILCACGVDTMKLKSAIIGILVVFLMMGCGGGGGSSSGGGGTGGGSVGTASTSNTPPVAIAGTNRIANTGIEIVFDGSSSSDHDLDPLTYSWTLVDIPSGSLASLRDEQTVSPAFTPDTEGIYTLQLIVHDGTDSSLPHTINVATSGMLLNSAPDKIFTDPDGVVYLMSSAEARIYRWSLQEAFPLEPIDVDIAPQLMAYAPSHHRLYIGYDTGTITMIDLAVGTSEAPFAAVPLAPHGLASAGNYVLVADSSGAWHTHYIFAADGTMTDSAEWNRNSRAYAWNSVNQRIYFFRDGTSPNDLHYEEIDQATGLITSDGETPYHGDYTISPPIRISNDGTRVLLGSGDVYDADTMDLVGSLPIEPLDAVWIDANGLVTIRDSGDGRTLVEQWDADYNLNNVQYFDGNPLRVCGWSGGYTVIALFAGQPAFNTYTPTDDGDGDGVPFSWDAFPLDPAASMDSDGDGYPDQWNPGMTAADSTTGLILDAFPNDSACQLPSHSLPGDPGVCDISNAIPNYTPDKIVVGSDDVVYLMSTDNDSVYRWSLTQNNHLNPIRVYDTPQLMAYGPSDHRLYLGYDSGLITLIDLAVGVSQNNFATVPDAPHGLASAGNYVLVADPSGAWHTHYIFAADGTMTDSAEWNRYSRSYAWNSVNQRIYFFRDGTSPNDLHYEEIDQATGLITSSGETPYHSDYTISPPIRISKDGTRVLLGSGDIYDADTMTWLDAMSILPVDAAWLDTGLLTVRSDGGRTLLEQWNADYTLNTSQYFDGDPLRICEWSGGFTVITIVGGQPTFNHYLPN